MLVLTRKLGEKVVVGGNVTITVVAARNGRVRLAIEAPKDVRVLRGELAEWWADETIGLAAKSQPPSPPAIPEFLLAPVDDRLASCQQRMAKRSSRALLRRRHSKQAPILPR